VRVDVPREESVERRECPFLGFPPRALFALVDAGRDLLCGRLDVDHCEEQAAPWNKGRRRLLVLGYPLLNRILAASQVSAVYGMDREPTLYVLRMRCRKSADSGAFGFATALDPRVTSVEKVFSMIGGRIFVDSSGR
jgi:hypothetical protein